MHFQKIVVWNDLILLRRAPLPRLSKRCLVFINSYNLANFLVACFLWVRGNWFWTVGQLSVRLYLWPIFKSSVMLVLLVYCRRLSSRRSSTNTTSSACTETSTGWTTWQGSKNRHQASGFGVIEVANPETNLPVGTLQNFLDAFMKGKGAREIDYVHGAEACLASTCVDYS
jgi:hypothetical protein